MRFFFLTVYVRVAI